MTRKYDPAVKVLVETSPVDWLILDGRRPAPVTLIDTDFSAVVSAAADCLLRVDDVEPCVEHLEFQAGHDSASLPGRLHMYNTIASYDTGLPVRSLVVVLKPEADSPQLTGVRIVRLPGEAEHYHEFRYGVLRVWEVPPERFLSGGPGLVPLAPVAAVSQAELPGLIRRMERRLRREEHRRELWTAANLLMGLRYPSDIIDGLLRGITEMRESSTYQAILAEGRTEGRTEGRAEGRTEGRAEAYPEAERRVLLLAGEPLLGPADATIRSAIEAISDVERLEQLAAGLGRAASWHELLGIRPPRRRRTRRQD